VASRGCGSTEWPGAVVRVGCQTMAQPVRVEGSDGCGTPLDVRWARRRMPFSMPWAMTAMMGSDRLGQQDLAGVAQSDSIGHQRPAPIVQWGIKRNDYTAGHGDSGVAPQSTTA
jgi:hypothetical protein